MTVSEQKFMELVPGALLRIATALEGINEKLELLAQQRQEPEPEPEQVQEEDVSYSELDKDVESLRLCNWQTKRAVTQALYHGLQFVSKECAASLACFYGGVTVKQAEEAIKAGQIEVVRPEMREVEYERWNRAESRHEKLTRLQPIGKYQVSLKSALLWLENNGRRGVAVGSPVYRCIERIVKS